MNSTLSFRKALLLGFGILLSITILGSYLIVKTRSIAPDLPIAIPKHKNCDDNLLPHIVYKIFIIRVNGEIEILKFGISSEMDYLTKIGNPRPELQCNYLQKEPEYITGKVQYIILFRNVPGRIAAKAIEQYLVNTYFETYGKMPLEQKRPIPKFPL